MADTETLANLRLRCRRLANQETLDQAQALCTDAEILDYLNHELRVVYLALVAAGANTQYYRSSTTITTVSGTETYAVPAGMLSVLSVVLEVSSEQREHLLDATESEWTEWRSWSTRSGYPARYQLRGSTIAIAPLPRAVYTITLSYVPTFTRLVNDADTFDGISGFEDAAVWRVVATMLAKDGADTSLAMARAAEWDGIIAASAPKRDALRPPRVQRVAARRRYGWGLR